MAKKYKIYITIRKDEEGKLLGWFIVDKTSPVDFQFKNKREALVYVKKNYEDVTVLVQNDQAKFQYTIVLEEKKVISFKSKGDSNSDENKSMSEDVKKTFKYEHIEEVKKPKKYKIYITTRKDKEGKQLGWFIVDKTSPVDFQFKNKREALDYVRKNYENVTVLVQNDQAKFQYTIVLEDKKVISFTSKADEESDDHKETTKDVEEAFKYTAEEVEALLNEKEEKNTSKVWMTLITIALAVSIVMAIAAIVISI